jgi:putative hydrolase of the HAD superfamily
MATRRVERRAASGCPHAVPKRTWRLTSIILGMNLRMVWPRAILFDLDDTLIHAHSRPEVAWLTVTRELGADLAPLTPAEATSAIVDFAQAFWADADRHREFRQKLAIARQLIVSGAFARLAAMGRHAPSEEVASRLADRFRSYRVEQMRLCEGAHETVDALRTRGIKLALVTNGDGPGQRAKIERFALANRFDHVQIEGEHGFGKPEERAYHHALEALGAAPQEAWIVGDNLEWEVAAPQALGLYAIWCDHDGDGLPAGTTVVPDRIVRALRELLD